MIINLPDDVADSLLRCLQYYEIDNLSPSDEAAIIKAIESATQHRYPVGPNCLYDSCPNPGTCKSVGRCYCPKL
jgi:hypothetical protein